MNEEMMPDILAKAEDGDAQAQYRLGALFENEKNYLEAAKWFRLAVAQGHSGAQNQLGLLYMKGHLEPDDVKTVELFRLAAEQGNKVSQYNLALMFEYGRGVAKDLRKAEYWYKQSADQGYEDAKNALVRLDDPKLRPITCTFCHFQSERGATACKGCQATIVYPKKSDGFWVILLSLILGLIVGGVVGVYFQSFETFIIVGALTAFAYMLYGFKKLSKMLEEGKVFFRRRMH